jgi:Ca2+-binding RTX toxin-like protein
MRGSSPLLVVVAAVVTSTISITVALAGSASTGAYFGDPGEQNDVTVGYDSSSGNYTFYDAGAQITTVDPQCTVSGNRASCPHGEPGYVGVNVQLGDLDDRVILDASVPKRIGGELAEPLLIGGTGNDQITGGVGPDAIYGDTGYPDDPNPGGDDILDGGPGDDGIFPEAGDDQVYGGDGDEQLVGNDGNDTLNGGTGDDYLDLAPEYAEGADRLDGGAGDDLLSGIEGTAAPDSITCGDDFDIVEAGVGDLVAADCEIVSQVVECTESAVGQCEGTLVINAVLGGGSGSGRHALQSAAVTKLRLGKADYKIRPGKSKKVRVTLVKKRVRQALRHRSKVPAEGLAKSHDQRKRLRKQRTAFTLKRK